MRNFRVAVMELVRRVVDLIVHVRGCRLYLLVCYDITTEYSSRSWHVILVDAAHKGAMLHQVIP